ncbi:rCG44207 [Rattus norvegicus]|uniref:RCG44207 n=1 Tax=Rattus norvegicus TaxID=10116 RepID=A6J7L0_RAT|nr:rCG44207 [Rattus norvegicus]
MGGGGGLDYGEGKLDGDDRQDERRRACH